MSSLRHLAPFVLVLAACGGGDDDLATEAKPAVEQYATLVYTGYNDSLTTARALDTAIDAFLAAPSAETLTAAKTAWKAARIPYRETEAYRFYSGPIDAPNADPSKELEPRINAWPVDEAFIDSVYNTTGDGFDHGGIVNDAGVAITAEVLVTKNFSVTESSVATGYHAIEFLLWGQDRSADGPGNRPYTDFVDGDQATLPNPARRREYLKVVSDLLVADLQAVVDQWDVSTGAYRKRFVGNPVEALGSMLRGVGALSGAELPTERMSTAYDNRDQEDEHSCFSDTTMLDLIGNAKALENVYLGRLGSNDGPGIDELVAARNPELDTKMKTQLTAALTALGEIQGPFDTAILDGVGETDGPRRAAVKKAYQAIRAIADTVVDVGEELGGIAVDIELPE
jgi:putative iron-regulated protein